MTIDRRDLLEGLQAVMPATASRSTKPILSCVLIDGQTLHATDLEIGIRYTLRADTGLVCCVRPDKLAAILKETTDDTIDAVLSGDTLTIRTSSGRFTLTTSPPDEFPKVEATEGESFTVPGLAAMVKKVAFAADKKESGARWAVTGVLFECEPGKLNLVATDTKRLALLPVAADVKEKSSAIVPVGSLSIVEKMPGDVKVTVSKSGIEFACADVFVVSRLVEGRFPPFRDIMPKKTEHAVSLNRELLLSSVRQAAVTMDRESSRMEFEFAPGKLTLRANAAEEGESEVTTATAGDFDLTIAFDPRYITEFLKVCDASEVLLEMTSGEKPAVFSAGEGYRYLVMPLAG